MKTRGFTLIELLVVIAIIGLLSSIVYATLGGQREKGKIARAQSDLKQIVQAIVIAQGEQGTTLLGFTGGDPSPANCMQCANVCTEDVTGKWPTGGTIINPNCKVAFAEALKRIEAATNGLVQGLVNITSDPWGNPYLFDANQGESGVNCSGPDSLWVFDKTIPNTPAIPLSPICP